METAKRTISGFQGLGNERETDEAQSTFRTVNDGHMSFIKHLSKPREHAPPSVNRNVNMGDCNASMQAH